VWTAHCHCESCCRQTASPVTTFFAVSRGGFEWTGENPGEYRSSPGVLRRFCRKCGSPVSYENETVPNEIHLYAAGLDDHAGFSAQRHDFWAERVAWLTVTDELPKE
jgi:hypothetical protein